MATADETVKTKKPEQPSKVEPIAINAIHFREPFIVPGTGGGKVTSQLNSKRREADDNYEIWLVPWLRQYKVTVHPHASGRKPYSFLVPESWVVGELVE